MPDVFKLRRAESGDAVEISELFRNTVRLINVRDYSIEEIEAWAPDDYPVNRMSERIANSTVFVTEDGTGLTGVASFKAPNFLDLLYVRNDRLRLGIGRRLIGRVEEEVRDSGAATLVSNVSITAKPFFLALGFRLEREQKVSINGQKLTNFRMVKQMGNSKYNNA